ncbi:ABC transporter ATP-binding protein [Neobacillus muris]|uniref:ABC transporter ATP-binding protein n=1 Tax=Neobacillus muris TaxID=2941334 RepID=UPI00203E3075|nr:ABC transporter ATP-binding protein [Neobacillus muris]
MNLLAVQDLRKNFGQFEAVKGLSFTVEKGESFGLLGPNGAGKSTAINMITGLFPPTSGEIRLRDIDIVRRPKQAQKTIGVVPQEIALYQEMSAKENLKFWGRMYNLSGKKLEISVDGVLEMIGLTDRARDKVADFSGGMKRRVNIGAAILHQPELLIMDEPTVGIDPQSRNHILETVKRLNHEGMTIIYTSHYMEEVEYLCERVGIIDHGQVIAIGTLRDLRESIGDRSRIMIMLDGETFNQQEIINHLEGSGLSVDKDILFKENLLTAFHKEPQNILGGLIQYLTRDGIKISSVEIVEPNLESIFLQLTGRSLRD